MAALPSALSAEARDEFALLTSELVTNAIRHGTRPDNGDVIGLVLWPADGHYWLAVSDLGDALPATASPATPTRAADAACTWSRPSPPPGPSSPGQPAESTSSPESGCVATERLAGAASLGVNARRPRDRWCLGRGVVVVTR